MLLVYVTFILISVNSIFCQDSLNCESKETCNECIQEINCVWCIKPINNSDGEILNHCAHKGYETTSTWCPKQLIVSPKSSRHVLENNPFTSDTNNPIQLNPQRIKLTLRKGEKIDIHFQYKQAENYPVDLYYIMDLSASMEKHREKLGELGVTLAEAMKNITKNFKLGFGSFIDKVDLPFVSTVPAKLNEPCRFGNIRCVPPYSFKHHLNLTSDYMEFKRQVTVAKVSGNLDAPEGGFDAIMQAIVCKDEIGWRSQARHLLVFSTDAEFHIAGDGKLAGVIEPNDATCHMTRNVYTDYLIYDYPSISQINHVAKENNINIVFAIVKKDTGNIRESYQKLSERIENSNFGELENNDNNNVVNLIIKNYNKIVQSVTLTSNATNDIDIKFSSPCKSPKPNGCSNIHVGEVVNFTATIQPRECSTNGQTNKIISIKPEAVDESLIIELEVLCNCPCSSSSDINYESNSAACNGKGDLECGVCNCLSGRFGRECQCDSSTSTTEDATNCQMNDQSEICSGLGECKCGKCECETRLNGEKIYGKFCQCNNYSCKREGGLLCSGKGICDCGDCKCQAGYTGDACQCPESNSTCIASGSDSICSNHGVCQCGQCECFVDKNRHTGKYCEECTSCPAQRCEEFRHCVECQAYQTGLYDENQCQLKCTEFSTIVVDKFSDGNDDIKKCRVPDKSGCIIIFEYAYNEVKELRVTALKEKLCAGPPNILAWILGVIGTILIAGIIMLIVWKICTTVHDRREYAKFENNRKDNKWHTNDNPIFIKATSTFPNPAYNRSTSTSSK